MVLLPLPGLCESTDCTAPVVIVADGHSTQSTFPINATYWYGIYAQAGHSYSLEFAPPADNSLNSIRVQFAAMSVFGPNDVLTWCRGSSSVSVTQNSGASPAILKNGNGAGRRVSFIASTAGLYLIGVTNVGGAGNYAYRAVDTTLFNPRWSTYGGYDDHYGFLNVSDMQITGILTVCDTGGRVLASVQVSIAPGTETFRFTLPSDLNIPRNSAGYATFSHNGPPNSIVADAFMVNGSLNVVYASRFEPRGSQ
jgi:hypothetical protein